MIIDCAHYQDGRRQGEGPVPLEEAAARCGQGGFVWLGLFEPGEQELAQVRDTFGLHELAVEDAQNFHMRPKIELYDQDVRLVILRTARYDDAAEDVDFGEISVFLAPTFVITVRQGVASELRGARQRLEQRPELLAAGSTSALWAILDQVVDGPSLSVRETVKKRASLISRVRALPSPALPLRPSVSLGRMGTPVPSTSTYSMSGTGSGGGSGQMTRARSPAASVPAAARAAAPDASADRSIVLAFTASPARSASSAAALPNGTSAPARAIIWLSPGDSDVPATPSCSSRGAKPCPHSRQWYQALLTRTGPSTVVMVLGLRSAKAA